MNARRACLLWLPPLLMQSADAYAWGLLTHVYFAQWLLWLLPLADPNLRRAAQRFPELVMAGACLPDLALVSPAFRDTHRWDHIQALLQGARTDEETAAALGYASHLLVDVVAHNHFVPAHEAMWFERTLFTHVTSEWAVDAHLASITQDTPHRLLDAHRSVLVPMMARRFRCTAQRAEQALNRLAKADRFLRGIRLPHLLYHGFRLIDRRVFRHFVYYVSQTQSTLEQIETVLQGSYPVWEADPMHDAELLQDLREITRRQLAQRHPAPLGLLSLPATQATRNFQTSRNEMPAMAAPSKAPANTSLG